MSLKETNICRCYELILQLKILKYFKKTDLEKFKKFFAFTNDSFQIFLILFFLMYSFKSPSLKLIKL